MSKYRTSKVYDITDIISWDERGELEISPKYQRNSVWNSKAKSYLIDTILRGLPIPPIFIRQSIDTTVNKSFKEILDGQQRIRTILEFYKNEFIIEKSQNAYLGGLNYSNLQEEDKIGFLSYNIPVEIVTTNDESVIYDMFARLNTNNMVLNKQEVRNAKYWGEFKICSYALASEIRPFFANNDIFKDKDFSRMLDVEFVSTLIILMIDGIKTDTPASIDKYYSKYDLEFSRSEEVKEKFKEMFIIIERIYENFPPNSKIFKKKVYFYTLFATIYNNMYGLNELESLRCSKLHYNDIYNNIMNINYIINEFEYDYNYITKNDNYIDIEILDKYKNILNFEKLHRTRTTNAEERRVRISILSTYIKEKLEDGQ